MKSKVLIRHTAPDKYIWIWLVGIVALTIFLRVYGQLDKVFVGDVVLPREVDPYLHLRLAEFIANNFPHSLGWDMYALYPTGAPTYPPVLAYIVATIAWVVGLGHPSLHLIDTVGVWVPPIAAGLVVIVVFFLGKIVFKSNFVGLAAGLLAATMPTEFFHRSLLGFTDHHVLEVLFATASILFLILATQRKSWRWGVATGVAMVLYGLNWLGWPMLAGILGFWAYGRFIIWLYRSRGPRFGYLTLCVTTTAIGLLIIFAPQIRNLAIGFITQSFFGGFSTIQEQAPLRAKDIWYLYGLAGILMAGGIAIAFRNKISGLFLVWALYILVISILEKRWGYYGTIALALFAAYFIWWLGQHVAKGWKPYILGYACIVTVATCIPYGNYLENKPNDITPDWYNACIWLRENTPPQFAEGDMYLKATQEQASYGILSWWDFGHWIIEIGHRVPVSSPTQQESTLYPFFTAATDAEANKVLEGWNIQYVIVTDQMIGAMWHAIHDKVYHNRDWQSSLTTSMAYRMFIGKVEGWEVLHVQGGIKIFRRAG